MTRNAAGQRSAAQLVAASVLTVVIASAVVVAVRSFVASDDDRTDGLHDETAVTHPQPPEGPSELADERLADGSANDQSRLVAALESGIERLMRSMAVEISFTATGTDGNPVRGTGLILPRESAFDMQESTQLPTSEEILEQRRLVDEVVYLRIVVSATPDPTVPWDAIPAAAHAPSDLARAFTAKGRAVESFERLLDVLTAVPFEAEVAGADGDYRARVSARRVAEYYDESGLEAVAHLDEISGVTTFEFTIAPDGTLARLSASGLVFQDGEPLEDVRVEITYTALPTPPSSIAPPPDADIRS